MLITSVYKLSPPPKKLVDIRNAKIKKCIAEMGNKYLLAKPLTRIQHEKA